MASDAPAINAELLGELVQDVAGAEEIHESDPMEPIESTERTKSFDRTESTTPAEDLRVVKDGEGDEGMSAEDVLRQLDSVTLSLDADDDGDAVGDSDVVEMVTESGLIDSQVRIDGRLEGTDYVAATAALAVEEDEDEEVMVDALEEAPMPPVGVHQEDEVVQAETETRDINEDAQALVVEVQETKLLDERELRVPADARGTDGETLEVNADDDTCETVAMEIQDASTSDQQNVLCTANDDETHNAVKGADETEWGAAVEEFSTEPDDAGATDDGDELLPDKLNMDEPLDNPSVHTTLSPLGDPALTEQTAPEGEIDSQFQHASGEGSWGPIVLPPAIDTRDNMKDVLSPPAPTMAPPQPVFSGCLNPAKSTGQGAGVEDEDDDDDSDSENEDEQVVLPAPLPLGATAGQEDEELEVDIAVADEIRVIKPKDPQKKTERQQTSSNPLLDAVEAIDTEDHATMNSTGDERSKTDTISLGFDDPIEVRSTQLTTAPLVHPESSSVAFGIGYQSLRKRLGGDGNTGGDSTYSITKGPTFHELESEVTLVSGVSLSQRRSDPLAVDSAEEEDEFGDIPDETEADAAAASPTRVETILQKTRASMAMRCAEEEAAALVDELKKATVHEKRHLHETEKSKAETDTALTVNELHSMYKRGLGDQEVCMLDGDDDGVANKPSSADELSSKGGILRNPPFITHTITEEGEEEEKEYDDTVNDKDAGAFAVNSERTATFAENSVASMRDDDTSEWKEIQLHVSSSPPGTSSMGRAAPFDANASSKITYAEALAYFLESDDVLAHRDCIVAEEKPPSASCFSCFSRPRLAFGGAIEQRDRVFCVAATNFDPRNDVHVRVLQTIYRKLLGSGRRADVALVGPHWEAIGFQGTDPSTDLRGCGVLSLLQMLHFVETDTELARRFHTVSQHPTRHFPLACALINVTLQCVVALRSGALYKECNKRSSVFAAANALHVAIASQLMKEIQSTNEAIPLVIKRVLDNGRLFPDRAIETHAASRPALESAGLQQQQQQQPSSRKSSAAAAHRASASHAAAGEFNEIGLHSVADD